MKKIVLEFLANLPFAKEAQFNEAFRLFQKVPGKSLSLERFYNQSGFSDANLKNIIYDLKQAAEISDADIRKFIAEQTTAPVLETKAAPEFKIKVIATNASEVFEKAPDEVKESIKLRDEFPFLDDKNCPEEFYILVGKKMAHYHAYRAAHNSLLVNIEDVTKDASPIAMTEEEITALALSAVADFKINQEIREELVHFKETGKILGKHPLFAERKLKSTIDAMTVEKGMKRISNLDNYIRRDSKKMAESKTEETKQKFAEKINDWQTELKLIKAKFGISDAK